MSETIDLKVTVDAKQAQSAIANVKGDIVQMGNAIGAGFDRLGSSSKDLQQRLAPTAAAISFVSGALGQTDTAIGKVVAGVGQAAAAFGAGGPWGLALAGSVIAVQAYRQESEKVEAALGVWRDQLSVVTPAQLAFKSAVADSAREASNLEEAYKNYGRTAHEVAIATATATKAELEAKLENIDRTERLRQANVNAAQSALESAKLRGSGIDDAKERLDIAVEIQARVRRDGEQYRSEVKSLEDSVWRIADAWAGVEKKAKETKAESSKAIAKIDPLLADFQGEGMDGFGAGPSVGETRQAKAIARREAAIARREAETADMIAADVAARQIQADNEKAFQENTERQAQEHYARMQALRAEYVSQTTSALTTVGAALGTLAVDSATGAEDAFASFVKAASSAAGGFVQLEGGKQIAKGLAYLADPFTAPLGAAPLAVGLGLVAAGAAISAGGPAAVSALTGSKGAAATGATGAAREPGASPRSAGSTGGGGPLVVNVSYGVTGPLPEDTAREIQKATRTAGRR